jgi:hypothetical protein
VSLCKAGVETEGREKSKSLTPALLLRGMTAGRPFSKQVLVGRLCDTGYYGLLAVTTLTRTGFSSWSHSTNFGLSSDCVSTDYWTTTARAYEAIALDEGRLGSPQMVQNASANVERHLLTRHRQSESPSAGYVLMF